MVFRLGRPLDLFGTPTRSVGFGLRVPTDLDLRSSLISKLFRDLNLACFGLVGAREVLGYGKGHLAGGSPFGATS